ncbi:MAG: tRNA (adenosine(37)-N6)-dimethylallyltransferase MiaA [Candidatus Saccharimonadales bacterium]
MATEKPLIVIVGPTASGKTNAAIQIAEKIGGEIICADSRTVYQGMDIGTAKPTTNEQARVPHWGIDLVTPGEVFTAADFQRYARVKIEEISGRGKVPLLVGGTGLYTDGVIFDYQFGAKVSDRQRNTLERMSLEELHTYCLKNNIPLPENRNNKRYVIRAIEQRSINHKRNRTPTKDTIIVGIATEKSILNDRIATRTEHLFEHGVVEEATILGKKYGWDTEAMTGNIYPLVCSYLDGERSLTEIKEKFTTLDCHLAKRQLTWFRANPWIEWLDLSEVVDYVFSRVVAE